MSRRRYAVGLVTVAAVALATLVASVTTGPTEVTAASVIDSLLRYDAAIDAHLVVRDIRLPRALLSLIVGGNLAAAGAVMQGVTRNPLASPSIMGLSGGAALGSLLAIVAWPGLSYNGSIAASLIGAALGYGCVLAVVTLSAGGFTPARLALAGVVTSAFFSAITQGLVITLALSSTMLYWTVGGITNVNWAQVAAVAPCSVVGLVGVLYLAPSITVLSLGSDLAVGLGQRSTAVRGVATLLVLLLTGSSVAVAGPIAFVGLITPHACRSLAGADYGRLLPLSILAGAGLTAIADLAARGLSIFGGEIPLGVLTAVIGAPCFLWLLRGSRASRLQSDAPVQGVVGRSFYAPQIVLPVLAVLLLVVAVCAVQHGEAELSFGDLIRTLSGYGTAEENLVLWTFRLPRLLFAALVGAGIAIAGTLLQAVVRNDLAEPGILGVTSGASLAIVLTVSLVGQAILQSVWAVPLAGFTGALATMLAVYALCLQGQHSSSRLLLTGVAISAVASAIAMLLSLQIGSEAYAFLVAFEAGSLNAAAWNYVILLSAVLGVLAPLAWSLAPTLNVLQLGEASATGLGVTVRLCSLGLLTLSVALGASCTSLAGGILFLGLIAPHIARRIVGADHVAVIPAAAMIGAMLLLIADVLGQSIFPRVEIPAGIMVAAVGSPYFLYLLIRSS